MAQTASLAALLHVAVQDLHAAKAAQVMRLGGIAEAARDLRLIEVLAAEVVRAAGQRDRLAAIGGEGGPANLWIAGILDDAERDARSHQPGVIRDIALVGAIRKAKAAEIVSSDTAVSLARSKAPAAIATLEANRAEEVASDHVLRNLLAALTGGD